MGQLNGSRHPGRVVHDLDAEQALIGDLVALPERALEAARLVTSADFADLRCAEAFRIITTSARTGNPVDATTLHDRLEQAGHPRDLTWLADVLTAGTGAWAAHADIIIRHRATRDALVAVEQLRTDLLDPGRDPFDLIDQARATLSRIDRPITDPPDTLVDVDTFLERRQAEGTEWVIDGLLRRDWRMIVTGVEGGGKSVLIRQLACLAAQGIHPLEPGRDIPPVTTLIVDLENPADALDGTFRKLISSVSVDRYVPGNAWLWHEPAGIDLRTRTDRARLEAVLHTVRPDLVCAGPIYKLGLRRGRETDEEVAGDLQETFDDLRTRYGFALVLEAHAPQDQGGHRATLRPFGSSRWLRWPELGFGLRPDDRLPNQPSVTIEKWRGDRMSNNWPRVLDGGGLWPWQAGYE